MKKTMCIILCIVILSALTLCLCSCNTGEAQEKNAIQEPEFKSIQIENFKQWKEIATGTEIVSIEVYTYGIQNLITGEYDYSKLKGISKYQDITYTSYSENGNEFHFKNGETSYNINLGLTNKIYVYYKAI